MDYEEEIEMLDHNRWKKAVWLTFICFTLTSSGTSMPCFNWKWAIFSTCAYKDMVIKTPDSLETKFWFIPPSKFFRPTGIIAKSEVSSIGVEKEKYKYYNGSSNNIINRGYGVIQIILPSYFPLKIVTDLKKLFQGWINLTWKARVSDRVLKVYRTL